MSYYHKGKRKHSEVDGNQLAEGTAHILPFASLLFNIKAHMC